MISPTMLVLKPDGPFSPFSHQVIHQCAQPLPVSSVQNLSTTSSCAKPFNYVTMCKTFQLRHHVQNLSNLPNIVQYFAILDNTPLDNTPLPGTETTSYKNKMGNKNAGNKMIKYCAPQMKHTVASPASRSYPEASLAKRGTVPAKVRASRCFVRRARFTRVAFLAMSWIRFKWYWVNMSNP